jgi:thiol-disulfide isomerase/thioredoxin
MRIPSLQLLVTVAMLTVPPASLVTRAAIYQAGDVVENFSLVDRATGEPVQLTNFSGQIVLLDWFAWWCPFCQAAAPQLASGIDEWYAERGGNPAGIPVIHAGVNLQPNQEAQTQNFVTRAQLERVLEDFDRAVANRFASSGQPIFAIINGVTNSPSHQPWELLYSRLGYGQTTFPVAEFRAAIDAVTAPPPDLPAAPTLSGPEPRSDGRLALRVTGQSGQLHRIESSPDLLEWSTESAFTPTSQNELIEVEVEVLGASRFFRVAAP